MDKIKTREKQKEIKVLDKSALISSRMKDTYIRGKKQVDSSADEDKKSPEEYAESVIQDSVREAESAAADLTRHSSRRPASRATAKKPEREHAADTSRAADPHEAGGASETASTEQWRASAKKQFAAQQRKRMNEKLNTGKENESASALYHEHADNPTPPVTAGEVDAPVLEADTPTLRLKANSRSIKRHEKNAAVKASSRQLRQERNAIKDTRRASDAAVNAEKASISVRKAVEREARKASIRVETARRTAKASAKNVKAAAEAMVKTVRAIIGAARELGAALASGGSVALIVMVLICLLGLLVGSGYGVLFSGEVAGEQTLQSAIQKINSEWQDKLNAARESCDYEQIRFSGSRSPWTDIIAIYAVRTASDEENGQEVVTMDNGKMGLLREIFWDMNQMDWYTETETETVTETVVISHEGETDENGDPVPDETKLVEKTVEHIYLCIEVSGKSVEEMQNTYHFTRSQRKQLAELLTVIGELNLFSFDLAEITSVDALAVWNSLPSDLSEERREVVYCALTLAGGKVHYFWGGKSLVLGNDPRWGQREKVWAAGSSTTGTYRPYGMDCSGFVDCVFYNASDGAYVIGQGGGCITQHNNCYAISWSDAIPGDLVFYPGDSHIGIFVGRDSSGYPLICHCASGSQNGVYVTGKVGFTSIARPYYFGD